MFLWKYEIVNDSFFFFNVSRRWGQCYWSSRIFRGLSSEKKGCRGGVTLIMAQVCVRTRGRNLSFFFFFFFFFTWKNDDPQWTLPRNPPCLRLHLIDRRKDPPEKLPAPFYSPRGPIKSWTRIPKDLVLKEPPTQYFSREMFEYPSLGSVV